LKRHVPRSTLGITTPQSLAPPNCLQVVQGVRYAAPLVGIPLLHCASQCLFHDSLCLFDLGEALVWIGFLQYRPIQLDPVKISHKNSSKSAGILMRAKS
jgi:hypothetical protein